MQIISDVFTVKEFCAHVRICKRTFYDLQARGEGPRLIRIGRRTLIARDTAKAWLREREGVERVAKLVPPEPEPPSAIIAQPSSRQGVIQHPRSLVSPLNPRMKKPW